MAVGRAAGRVVFEVREQFRNHPGIMDYTEKPEYGRVVDICTRDSLRELATPGLLAVLMPIAVGFAFGYAPLGSFLAGAIAAGALMAVFLANSGGAWDNAKKLVEDGNHGGKGSEAHAATVIGDTVGDPFKDTAGPAINPLIKVMNLVSLLIATSVVEYSAPRPAGRRLRSSPSSIVASGDHHLQAPVDQHRGRRHRGQDASRTRSSPDRGGESQRLGRLGRTFRPRPGRRRRPGATMVAMQEARKLIVMRHAKAGELPGGPDFERALRPRGQRDSAAAGRWLAGTRVQARLVLCSAARRTRQTWQYLSASAVRGAAARFTADQRLYDADSEDVADVLRETAGGVRTFLYIGHNPAAADLVGLLTGTEPDFPTAAIAVIGPARRLGRAARRRRRADWRPGRRRARARHRQASGQRRAAESSCVARYPRRRRPRRRHGRCRAGTRSRRAAARSARCRRRRGRRAWR